MTKVSILPVATPGGDISYIAVSGEKRSQGATAGAALDALTAQLTPSETSPMIVVQNLRADALFTAQQQQRLGELMQRWRDARDRDELLPGPEQNELKALVEAELRASTLRTAAAADEIGP